MPQEQSSIAAFRERYPMYSDLSDQEIADALYQRHYSDMDRADFDARVMPVAEPEGPSLTTRAMRAAIPAVASMFMSNEEQAEWAEGNLETQRDRQGQRESGLDLQRRTRGMSPDELRIIQIAENRARRAAERRGVAEEMAAGERQGATIHAVPSAVAGFGQSVTQIGEDVLNTGAIAEGAVRGLAPSETASRGLADRYDNWQTNAFPADPARREMGELGQAVAEGAGSTLPMLGAGYLAGGGKVGTAVMAGMGSMQQGSAQLSDAIAHGADGGQQYMAWLAGAGIGASEAVPLARGMQRMDAVAPGRFNWMEILRQGGAEAVEESLQEGFQGLSSNVAALPYDEDRDVFEGVDQGMLVGGIVGGGIGGAQGGAGQVRSAGAVREMDDERLVLEASLRRVQIEHDYAAGRNAGMSQVEAINALADQADQMDAFQRELERRGLEEQAPAMPEAIERPVEPAPVPVAQPETEPEMAVPENVEYVDPRSLEVDAARFQFKEGGDSQGVTDRLNGVTQWDPVKANIVTVFEQADGRRFIADGHQRRGLAMRLIEQDPSQAGQIRMLAHILRESDGYTAERARVVAALKNIAEGTGTSIDAAKVLRTNPEELDASLPKGSALVKQAMGLARLSDKAFGAVVNEVIPENHGAIVGRLVEDPAYQMPVIDVLAKTRPATAFQAEAIVRQTLSAGFAEQRTGSLFGEEVLQQSLIAERAKVLDVASREIRNNKRVFSTLAREADNIEAAGNELNRDENARRASQNAQLEQILQKLATRRGPISDALNQAAQRIADGERIGKVAREFAGLVQDRVADGGLSGTLADGSGSQGDERSAAEVRGEQKRGLQALIESSPSIPEIEANELVQEAIAEMEAIQPTSEIYDFSSQDYIDSRPFNLDGEVVRGVVPALTHHYKHATTLAWTDDKKAPPDDPVGYDRQITFVIGFPAAGKSTLANPAAQHLRAAILDADEFKKTIPEYAGGIGASATHQESSALSKRLFRMMLEDGVNIVWPKVGNNPQQIAGLIQQAQEAGYTANLIWQDTAPDEAMRRMIGRFIDTDRIIPPHVMDIERVAFQRSYDYLVDTGLVENAVHVDGNRSKDVGPVILSDDGGILDGSEIQKAEDLGRDGSGRGSASTVGSGAGGGAGGVETSSEGAPNLFGRVARTPIEAAPDVDFRSRPAVARGSAPAAEKNLAEITDELVDRLKLPAVRQGRLSVRGALGQYDRSTGVIRLKKGVDFGTLAHEAGHSLAFMHRGMFEQVRDAAPGELAALAAGVDSNHQTLMDEGFAELVRAYLVAPKHAEKGAPNAYAALERFMFQADPELLEAMQDAQRAYAALIAAPSGESIAADVVRTNGNGMIPAMRDALADPAGTMNAVSNFANGLYTATIDKGHPIKRAQIEMLERYEDQTGNRMSLAPSKDAYMLSRLATDARNRGHMDLMHGVTPYGGVDPEGPSLAEALEVALGRRILQKWDDGLIAELDSYLISRRAVQEWRRYDDGLLPNPPDKFSRADHQLNIRELDAKYPEFGEAAEMIYEWQTRLLALKRDAGLISADQFQQYVTDHPDYVPFMRDHGRKAGDRPGQRVQADGSNNGQRGKFRGSDRAIISPIEMMMRDAFLTAETVARNDMIGALYDLASNAEVVAGDILEEIPNTEMRAQRIDAKEVLRAAAREAEASPRDVATIVESMDEKLNGHTFGVIYRAQETTSRGEPVIYYWRNGERKALRVGDTDMGQALFDAVAGIGREQLSFPTQVASAFATTLRYGITTSPEFVIANYVRDQVSAWILTDNFTPIMSGAKQLASDAATGGEIARRYNTFGGIMGGGNVAAVGQASVESDIQALRKQGHSVRRFASWKGFAEFTELSETNTRMSLFNEAFQNARKQGMGDKDAAIQAAFMARDYIDFGRYGSRMLAAKRVLVFLNASLQGLDKSARVLSGGSSLRRILRPLVGKKANMTAQERRELALAGKAWAKLSLALGGVSLALTAMYGDEPWYNELSEYARDTHWWVKIGDEIMGIPKPFELAVPANIIERAYEAHSQNDPNSWERMRRGVMRLMAPPVENPLVSVPIELYANKDFFRGSQIVPTHMQGLSPAEQWNAYTSAFGRETGEALGVSPMVIDHVVTGFAGSWGRTALNASDALAPDGTVPPTPQLEDAFILRRFFKDPFRGARSVDEFWQQMNTTGGHLERASSTYQRIANSGEPERATAFLLDQEPIVRQFVLAAQHAPPAIRAAHPMIRADKVLGVYGAMRREINGEGLRYAGTEQLVPISPDQAAAAENVLRRMAVLEAAEALALTGFPGYQDKPRLDRSDLVNELSAISPALRQEMERRMAAGRIMPAHIMQQQWPRLRDRLEEMSTVQSVEPLARQERMRALQREM